MTGVRERLGRDPVTSAGTTVSLGRRRRRERLDIVAVDAAGTRRTRPAAFASGYRRRGSAVLPGADLQLWD